MPQENVSDEQNKSLVKSRGKVRRGVANILILLNDPDSSNSFIHTSPDKDIVKPKTRLSSLHLCSDMNIPDHLINENATDLVGWSDENSHVVKVEEGRGWNFFGYYECGTPVKLNVTMPVEIVKTENKDIYIIRMSKTILPANIAFRVQILQVTQQDEVLVKLEGNAKPGKGAYENMKAEMERFYGNSQNMKSTQFTSNGWTLVSGQVVVVRITRIVEVPSKNRENNNNRSLPKMEYLRAKILEFSGDGATINLLDEYGSGGVILDAIFKIQPEWTTLPAQIFTCKLHGMEFFNGRSLVQDIVKMCPLPEAFRNVRETSVKMRFSGYYSDQGFPFVQLELINGLEILSLKDFVLERLPIAMNPFTNQVASEGLPCRIVQYDKVGHIWLKFTHDEELGMKIHARLQMAQRAFDELRGTCYLCITDIVNKKYGNCNLKQMFVASLPDVHDESKNVLQRVKIKRYFLNYNKIRVVSLDYGIMHVIDTSDILPLSCFCSDLCQVPPLVHKAHLHMIKSLSTKNELVQTVLFESEANISLVHQNPVIGKPPEVQLYLNVDVEELERQQIPDSFLLKNGVAKYLLEKQSAVGTPMDEILLNRIRALQIKSECFAQSSQARKPMISSFFSNFQFAWPT